ncbi:MAG: DUF3299 domain-containing protein [Limisphaerales bacterium]
MNRRQSNMKLQSWLVCIAMACLLTACSPAPPRETAPADIRGEPIVSETTPPPVTNLPASDPDTSVEQISLSDDDLGLVGFDRLSGYNYEARAAELASTGATNSSAIPQALLALNGQEVAIRGFMLPLKFEGGLVTELLLMRDQSMCCFGVVPNINDWVAVTLPPPGVKAILDQPVILFGTLEVGEEFDQNILSSIYRMQGEEMLDALDL